MEAYYLPKGRVLTKRGGKRILRDKWPRPVKGDSKDKLLKYRIRILKEIKKQGTGINISFDHNQFIHRRLQQTNRLITVKAHTRKGRIVKSHIRTVKKRSKINR